jgi:hypothetical protein
LLGERLDRTCLHTRVRLRGCAVAPTVEAKQTIPTACQRCIVSLHSSQPLLALRRSSAGQRLKASTHKAMRFRPGTNAKAVHHRLRPARCRTVATGTATRMITSRGITVAMSQCHSAGTTVQTQNCLQRFSNSPPRFVLAVTSAGNRSAHHHHREGHQCQDHRGLIICRSIAKLVPSGSKSMPHCEHFPEFGRCVGQTSVRMARPQRPACTVPRHSR